MTKNILYDLEARMKLLNGIEQLTKAVSPTLGPKGRTVLISQPDGSVKITKDGSTVAESIILEDAMEKLGAELVKEVAGKTSKEAGDGSTTAVILAKEFFKKSLKYTTSGSDPEKLKQGMEMAVARVINFLKGIATPVENDDELAQIATISANGDAEIGSLVMEAFKIAGKDGVVQLEGDKGNISRIIHTPGLKWDKGYLSRHFVNEKVRQQVVFNDPLILVTDHKISALPEIIHLLDTVALDKKPLLLIAESIDEHLLSTLVLNVEKGVLQIAAVNAPGYGKSKSAFLEDIAVATGAKFIRGEQQELLKDVQISDLGSCNQLIIDQDSTLLMEGKGNPDQLSNHIAWLDSRIQAEETQEEKVVWQNRKSFVNGGVVKISLSAQSELELGEKMDRAEDAVSAAKAALEEGILVGGGLALRQAQECLDRVFPPDQDQVRGLKIVRNALAVPLTILIKNGGKEPDAILRKLSQSKRHMGYNAATDTFQNLRQHGVIDPLKVVRSALENAISIAGLLLMTYCIVADTES